MQPKVSVIVLNYKYPLDTMECIQSLSSVSYSNYEVIVLDNGSKDDSVKLIKNKCPNVRLIENKENFGYAEGNNIGIREALKNNPEYILLLNNDTLVERSFLSKLVDVMENDKELGMASPLICFYPQKDIVWSAGADVKMLRAVNRCFRKKIPECDFVNEPGHLPACCVLVRTEVIKKIGLFDPEYFLYCEDLDLSLRVKKAGFKLGFVAGSVIYHKGSLTTDGEESPVSKYYGTRNRFLVLKRHGTFFVKTVFYLIVLPLVIIKNIFVLSGKRKSLNAFFCGISDGLHGRFGKNFKYSV